MDDDIDDDKGDDDFTDDGLEAEEAEIDPAGSQKKSGRRGVDLPWDYYDSFETIDEFNSSEIFKELDDNFSRRSGKASSTEIFHCKFLRRKGYNCQCKRRVLYS